MIRDELGDSALFGLRFRQNAGRALLMPRPDPAKRTPLWLQRLRAKDLLQVVRRLPDFPIVVETYRECLDDDLDLPRLRAFLDAIAAGAIRVVGRRGEIPSPFASELIFRFTPQYLYEWDEPRRGDRRRTARPSTRTCSTPCSTPPRTPLARPGRDRPGRGPAPRRRATRLARPTRWPRRSDASATWPPASWPGRCSASSTTWSPGPGRGDRAPRDRRAPPLDRRRGRPALRVGLPGRTPRSSRTRARPALRSDDAVATIVRRFLQSHALIGLDDLTARYPIEPGSGQANCWNAWPTTGGLVRLVPAGDPDAAAMGRRAEPGRGPPAVDRPAAPRERGRPPRGLRRLPGPSPAPPPVPRLEGSAAVGLVLEQLHGFAAPAGLWESELLPRRVRDYRPGLARRGHLDRRLALAGRGRGEPGASPASHSSRATSPGGWPAREEVAEPSEDEVRVRDHLARRGASFASDLARELGLEPSRTRRALLDALRRGLVTNDRFDPMRPGAQAVAEALAEASAPRPSRRPTLGRPRPKLSRAASNRPEGRWSLLAPVATDPEAASLAWIAAMLDRYGVLTRETAALDAWAPPWRDLVPWLARAELRGELRRGYFVEGLSGVQYASAEAAEGLARLAAGGAAESEPVLMSTLDPANLYGSGAPLDVPLLEGGTARLVRSPANYLVLCGGRPMLIIEAFGRRLTGLASASEAELRAALALVATLAGPSRRILKVETYNSAATLASPAAPWLADLGFVRDPPGMAFYAGW